ncbi:MAG: DNA primase [Bacillota bacterium]
MIVIKGPIPEEIIAEIRQHVDIVEFISEYVLLKRRGHSYTGLCPFHQEKTPSFTVSHEKQMFYCFGCKTGGNVYTFLMKQENLTFTEAVQRLADRTGIEVPQEDWSTVDREAIRRQQRLQEINQLAADYFHYLLTKHASGKMARQYLEKRAVNEQLIQRFQLGYAPPGWQNLLEFLACGNFSAVETVSAGLALASEEDDGHYDRFRNRIMFPIFDVREKVIGFGGRVLDAGIPKYLNSPETPAFHKKSTLYGLNFAIPEIRKQERAIIVEGYMDVLAAHQHGVTNVVASLGTALTREQALLLRRYTQDVVIAYDADVAGSEATVRGLEVLHQNGFRVKVITLPPGQDPDDYLRHEGVDAFRQMLEVQSLSLIEYKLKQAMAMADPKTSEGKADIVSAVLDDLSRIGNEVEKQEYVRFIAGRLAVSEEAIYIELRKRTTKMHKYGTMKDKTGKNRYNSKQVQFSQYPAHLKAERAVAGLILRNPELFQQVQSEINIESLEDAAAREVILAIKSTGQTTQNVEPASIIDLLDNEEAVQLVTQGFLGEPEMIEGETVLEDCLRTIKLHHIQQAIDRQQSAIDTAEKSGNITEVSRLLDEKADLHQKMSYLKKQWH